MATCLALPLQLQAKSPVWKISAGDKVLFLAGTLHVLAPSDYPLPEAFNTAYANADEVVLEADIQQLQEPAFQSEMMAHLLYPADTSLKQKLDPETYQALQDYLQTHSLHLQQIDRFKPGMLASALTMLELQRLGMAGSGVDQYFSELAQREHKPQAELETAMSQVEKIAAMGEGQESEFVRHTLQELQALPNFMQELKSAWRRGDTTQLQTLAIDPLRDFPEIYQSIMVDRNMAWLPKIVAMLDDEEVEFVLVGAAHLVGEDGLLQQLDSLGYAVEQQ